MAPPGSEEVTEVTLAIVKDRLERLTAAVEQNNVLQREKMDRLWAAFNRDHDLLMGLEPRVQNLEGDLGDLRDAVSARTNGFRGSIVAIVGTLLAHVGLGVGKP
ncbi:MAG: hypothetical protein ACM3US_12655 [Sphingomonadaceae bacterium]